MNTISPQLTAVFSVILGVIPLATATPKPFTENEALAIDAFLQANFKERKFGVVIGLIDENGTKVFSAGKLGDGTAQKVDGDTVFEIGSVTKTFTSLLLLDMARRGEVKLDDPAAKYLPESVKMPTHGGKEITLLSLAAQDSGLPFNASNLDESVPVPYDAYTTKDMYRFLSEYKLTVTPGERFQYSNIGMSLLGHVMETRSGMDFESLVINRICGPLGMDSTRVNLTPALKSRLAVGYNQRGQSAPPFRLQVMEAAGALKSTANDMLKYLAAQLGFVDSELRPLIEKSQAIQHRGGTNFGNTATPWFDQNVYQPRGSTFLGHSGGTLGTSSFVGFDTQQKRGVVVLTNQRIEGPGNRRMWKSAGYGWAILQGLPLTLEHGAELVYEHVGLGVGLEFDEEIQAVRITKIYPQSPAGRAKLSVGLVLKKVNDNSTKGLSLADCLALIKGPEGKPVNMEFFNPNANETRSVQVARGRFLTSN